MVLRIAILGLLACLAAGDLATKDLSALRKEVRAPQHTAPSAKELDLAETLFGAIFKGERHRVDDLCRRLDLEALHKSLGGEPLLVVREKPGALRGWGFYVFRQARDPEIPVVAIQAPHAFHDLYTGAIAEALFEETDALSAAWNTAHRRQDDELGPADLCHLPDSIFQRYTRAFATSHARGRVLQLHGFRRDKRTTAAGRRSQVILSHGSTRSRDLPALARRLAPLFDGSVSVFPDDVKELGGTTNEQGRELRRQGHPGFHHVELGTAPRRQLRDRVDSRRNFWRVWSTP